MRLLNKNYRSDDAREDINKYFSDGYYLWVKSLDDYKKFNYYSLISIDKLVKNSHIKFRYGVSKGNKGKVDILGLNPSWNPIDGGRVGFKPMPSLIQVLNHLIKEKNRGFL